MATLATSGAAVFKAGEGVSTSISEAQHNYALLQAEGVICAETRYNWIDAYATLNADVKYILEQVCSDLAAIYLINYDTTGYKSTAEAQTMLDVLKDRAEKSIKTLTDIKTRDFVTGA